MRQGRLKSADDHQQGSKNWNFIVKYDISFSHKGVLLTSPKTCLKAKSMVGVIVFNDCSINARF